MFSGRDFSPITPPSKLNVLAPMLMFWHRCIWHARPNTTTNIIGSCIWPCVMASVHNPYMNEAASDINHVRSTFIRRVVACERHVLCAVNLLRLMDGSLIYYAAQTPSIATIFVSGAMINHSVYCRPHSHQFSPSASWTVSHAAVST